MLRNGTRVPKGCFVAAKIGDFTAISQLRNEGKRLRNGTRVPRRGFAAAKIFAEGGMGL